MEKIGATGALSAMRIIQTNCYLARQRFFGGRCHRPAVSKCPIRPKQDKEYYSIYIKGVGSKDQVVRVKFMHSQGRWDRLRGNLGLILGLPGVEGVPNTE